MSEAVEKLSWLEKLDQRSLRERLMVLFAVVAVLIFLWDLLFYQPLIKEQKILHTQTGELQEALTDLATRERIVLARGKVDPDQETRTLIEVVSQEIEKLDKTLEKSLVGLISPADMPGLLRSLLVRQKGLRLVSLENLRPTPLELAPNESKSKQPVLFQHGLQMVFEGSFLNTLSYLKSLGKVPNRLFWETLEIELLEYPKTRIKLKVHTLSLKEGWIGV